MMRSISVAVAVLAGCALVAVAAEPLKIRPADGRSMSVILDPDGKYVTVKALHLTFDEPEIREHSTTGNIPRDFAKWFEPWEPWPQKGLDKKLNTIELGPRRDENDVPILGGLYKSVQPESVVVTTVDGSKTFEMGVDYKFNADWGQIANIDGRLGEHEAGDLKVTCRYALQRLDLIQVDKAGNISIKKGTSRIVCPALPEPDKGSKALASVYIAPWRQNGLYAITADNIFPINPAPPVEPINPAAVGKTLAKLRAGEDVAIAFIGASVTQGAEACHWWDDKIKFTAKDYAYRGRVIYTLRKRYPKATIKPVEAYKGGTTTQYGLKVLERDVKPYNPGLAIICFGGNDASSAIGKPPRNSVATYKQLMTDLVREAKASGMEVILVAGMQKMPWLKNGVPERWPAYIDAMKEVGREQDVAVADVYTEGLNLQRRGIPDYSQKHNWSNHPGAFGHKVYADVILRFFQ